MGLVIVLIATTTFPVACLGFLLWMARIEDSIPTAVARAVRAPEPPPVLRIPVRQVAPPGAVIPRQRSAVSRSGVVSLGGSTNR